MHIHMWIFFNEFILNILFGIIDNWTDETLNCQQMKIFKNYKKSQVGIKHSFSNVSVQKNHLERFNIIQAPMPHLQRFWNSRSMAALGICFLNKHPRRFCDFCGSWTTLWETLKNRASKAFSPGDLNLVSMAELARGGGGWRGWSVKLQKLLATFMCVYFSGGGGYSLYQFSDGTCESSP